MKREIIKTPGLVPFAVYRVMEEGYVKDDWRACKLPKNWVYERGFMSWDSAWKWAGRNA